MEQQNLLARDRGTCLEQAAASLGQRVHRREASGKILQDKVGGAYTGASPQPCLQHHGVGAIGSVRGAAASHHGQGGLAPVPERERQSDAPSPRTAREGAARVGDNKLHESPDLGTAREEKARGLISLGIQSL